MEWRVNGTYILTVQQCLDTEVYLFSKVRKTEYPRYAPLKIQTLMSDVYSSLWILHWMSIATCYS